MKIATQKLTEKLKDKLKAVAKTVTQVATKSTKTVAKPTVKTAVKTLPKATTASVAKVADKKVATKASPVAKVAKAAVAKVSKSEAKALATSSKVKIKEQVVAAKPSKDTLKAATTVKAKSDPGAKQKSEPKVASTISQSSMPTTKSVAVTSNIAPIGPAASKARTSRLASLTVPSMAQSVASTAAKSSYGQASPSPILFAPPQFVAKQNPKLANNWKTKTAEELTNDEVLAMPMAEYMNIKQMMFFRLKLQELKKGILESAGATTEHLRDESAVVPDPTDRATIEEEHALELRTRDRERKLLKKIEQSIARIDAGDYGYCDETGEAIGVGRLLARPTATLSLEAQQRRELKQKMFGD